MKTAARAPFFFFQSDRPFILRNIFIYTFMCCVYTRRADHFLSYLLFWPVLYLLRVGKAISSYQQQQPIRSAEAAAALLLQKIKRVKREKKIDKVSEELFNRGRVLENHLCRISQPGHEQSNQANSYWMLFFLSVFSLKGMRPGPSKIASP